ncbi:MAG TPA: hypothetical protein ENL20_02430 [Candidatus Cloacimonetes bacterium]|nr:hypothetical protein [Candidatus Cloacimonadota bacterium]
MKKLTCLFLISIITFYSFAENKNEDIHELSLSEKFKQANTELLKAITKKRIIFTGISPAIAPRLYLGLVKINKLKNERIREDIFFIHGFHLEGLQVYGLAVKCNYFKEKRTGLYKSIIVGLDYAMFPSPFGDPGGSSNWGSVSLAIPTLAFGLGYSFQISENSFCRISLDAGFKILISNLNITFVF